MKNQKLIVQISKGNNSMNIEKINLEIEGQEFECEVEFYFSPRVPAKLFAAPENCYPEEPEMWEFSSLKMMVNDESHDVSFLIKSLVSDLIQKIEDARS